MSSHMSYGIQHFVSKVGCTSPFNPTTCYLVDYNMLYKVHVNHQLQLAMAFHDAGKGISKLLIVKVAWYRYGFLPRQQPMDILNGSICNWHLWIWTWSICGSPNVLEHGDNPWTSVLAFLWGCSQKWVSKKRACNCDARLISPTLWQITSQFAW